MIPSTDNPLGYRFFESSGFPDHWEGNAFKTGFRTWLRASWIMSSPEVMEAEKVDVLITLCYKSIKKNASPEKLFDGIGWFYQCGESDRMRMLELPVRINDDFNNLKSVKRRKRNPVLSYFWDFKEIWASFHAAYKIDLYKIENLHWWAFAALFNGLGSDSAMGRLMRARTLPEGKPSNEEAIIARLSAVPMDWREVEKNT